MSARVKTYDDRFLGGDVRRAVTDAVQPLGEARQYAHVLLVARQAAKTQQGRHELLHCTCTCTHLSVIMSMWHVNNMHVNTCTVHTKSAQLLKPPLVLRAMYREMRAINTIRRDVSLTAAFTWFFRRSGEWRRLWRAPGSWGSPVGSGSWQFRPSSADQSPRQLRPPTVAAHQYFILLLPS